MIHAVRQSNFLVGDTSASRASLCSVGGFYSYNSDTSFFRFISEYIQEIAPSGIIDGFSQHPARKSFYSKIFMCDEAVLIHKLPCRFMMKVFSLVSNMMMQFCNFQYRFLATITALFLSGKRTLSRAKFFLCLSEKLRSLNMLTIGRNEERLQSKINPNWGVSGWRHSNIGHVAEKCSIPFAGTLANRNRCNTSVFWNFAMPLDLYCAYEFKNEFIVFNMATVGVDISKRVKAAISLKPWIARIFLLFNTPEKILESCIEPTKSMLAGRTDDLRKIFITGAHDGKMGRLLSEFHRLFLGFISSLSPFKRTVIKTTMCFKSAIKSKKLFSVWVKSVFETLEHIALQIKDPPVVSLTLRVNTDGSMQGIPCCNIIERPALSNSQINDTKIFSKCQHLLRKEKRIPLSD